MLEDITCSKCEREFETEAYCSGSCPKCGAEFHYEEEYDDEYPGDCYGYFYFE